MPNKVLFGPEKLATTSTPGLLKASGSGSGLQLDSNGYLKLSYPSASVIKTGTNLYAPVVVGLQHESTFYGLAKAAGDSTQAASSNAVGSYTDNAKAAIQKMIDIYEPPFVLLNDITLDERTCIELTADSNGTSYDLIGIFMEIYYAANLVSETSGYGRYYFYDNDNKYLTAETGKYVTATLANYKLIEITKKNNLTRCDFTRIINVGSYGTWAMKSGIASSVGGYRFDMGNITAIKMNTRDYEPIGTRIKVWGQWAY